MFVTSLSEEDTQRINSVRIILDAEAMKLCRVRYTRDMDANLSRMIQAMETWESGSDLDAAALDLEFHRAIWGYSGNPILVKTLDSLVAIVLAHHALDSIANEMARWTLKHYRALLGNSKLSPEEAIVSHFRMGYPSPERFSSFGLPTWR
jgi:DNA-binding GntR family transcriptional regulator